ncbi:MFS transporter TsgA [Candidatus Pantoea carbekii]|uniref:MFS transporter TsgA n=1 Tax=Candidatus Pantoea carbekii TaxID=1235990 RepID=UPI00061875F4|nr:MFS transporter TsgA [Candidatus Pantoea carbekii]AKC32459.1 protein TsgA [Candidatus Pantoea carbekii]
MTTPYNYTRIGLTWISFLSYALTGALVITSGMILDNIAQYFHLPISEMSHTFTFLNAGILVSVFFNAWLMIIIPLKRQLIYGFILIILAIVTLTITHNIIIFSICMFMLGIVSGITMSIGTFLITYLYAGRQRGSRLLFSDSFFSFAGTIFPIISAILLTHALPWYWIYVCISIIYLFIFILTLFIEFPEIKNNKAIEHAEKEKWGLGVLFLSIAALCYILGQLSFISWIPVYLTKSMGMNIVTAGQLVGNFWMSYMIGMWIFSSFMRFFDLHHILVLLTAVATSLMCWFIIAHDITMLRWIIIILGFSSSAIYTTVITLASLQTKVASPKLVNFILTSGTVGTMLTFIVTAPIVENFGVRAALILANGLYGIVFIMCVLLGFFSKHRQHDYII